MTTTDQAITSEPRNGTKGTNSAEPTRAASGTTTRSAEPRRDRDDAALLPPVDVVEDAGGITLYADLPGVPKDRLAVRVEADTLSIEGELGLAMPEGIAPTHAEVQLKRYRRTFTLSKELDAEHVDAEFNDGVLRVRIPKSEDAKPKRIQVRVN